MMTFVEMDPTVALADQLGDEGGPVVLFNVFTAPSEDADRLLAAWAADAAVMKRQPGFISTQLHRGIAGSGAFLNTPCGSPWPTSGRPSPTRSSRRA